MEKGEMRVEANISVTKVRPLDSEFPSSDLGTKVEVKNLNSFKVVEKAIKFEMDRQIKVLEEGGKVVQETRGWDEKREVTFSQRLKESAHDYRYFPDPDLPKLFIKEIGDLDESHLRNSLPELPWEKRERYKKSFGLKEGDIEIYVREPKWGGLFEETIALLADPSLAQLTSNYITSDLKSVIAAEHLAKVIRMVSAGEISSRGAKEVLKAIESDGGEPRTIAIEKNLIQESDREVLKKLVGEVSREHATAPIQFLVGQAMKKSGNRANPVILQELFLEMLDR